MPVSVPTVSLGKRKSPDRAGVPSLYMRRCRQKALLSLGRHPGHLTDLEVEVMVAYMLDKSPMEDFFGWLALTTVGNGVSISTIFSRAHPHAPYSQKTILHTQPLETFFQT